LYLFLGRAKNLFADRDITSDVDSWMLQLTIPLHSFESSERALFCLLEP